jgi:hypothetical protein
MASILSSWPFSFYLYTYITNTLVHFEKSLETKEINMSREKKWTPGPWELDEDTRPAEVCTVHHLDSAQGWVYIRGEIGYWEADGKENLANANLIAAAPELLDELEKQCFRCFQDQLCNIPDDCRDCTTRKAIAKAYGE